MFFGVTLGIVGSTSGLGVLVEYCSKSSSWGITGLLSGWFSSIRGVSFKPKPKSKGYSPL